MSYSLMLAALGTGFTFLMTALGAATVLIMKKSSASRKAFMGFAAGVMMAASVWSLLIPCVERSEAAGMPGFLPATGGFILGCIFLMFFGNLVKNRLKKDLSSGRESRLMLISAIVIHNIPEGMAVGLSFAAVTKGDMALLAPAAALALGIGIQNFPEGAAVALPMLEGGSAKGKAFVYGALSGIVEPVFGILTVLIASVITAYLPWMLSFAAGAMIFAVVSELIPEAAEGKGYSGAVGAMLGFSVMMLLDLALG